MSGPAGIGKTTIWTESLARAEARRYRVLSSRPSEAEAKLSYAAVGDLAGPVFDELRSALPPPQERALMVALLRAEDDEPTELRTVATAFATLVARLAERSPVVLAVDDVQWLDSASAQTLEFVIRRLEGPVGVVVTERAEDVAEPPLGIGRALAEDHVERHRVEPLSFGALHRLITQRLGLTLPRPLLARIAAASGGNPYFAIELARALTGHEREPASDEPLHVPPTLQELVAARIATLSREARRAVFVASASSAPTVSLLAAAGSTEAALHEAEDAGVLVTDRQRLRFAHPLLASVVYGAATGAERRAVHRLLADLAGEPEERARHRAQATLEADAVTAQVVEAGARHAAGRGAHDAAAELFAESVRLTPRGDRDDSARRLLGSAVALNALGDFADAREVGERSLAQAESRPLRTEILSFLAGVAWFSGDAKTADELLERALDGADGDVRGRLHAKLARYNFAYAFGRAVRHADLARETLREETEPALVAHVLVDRLLAGAMAGLGADETLLARAAALEENAYPHLPEGPQPMILIWHHCCTDDVDAARERHAFEDAWYRDRGEDVRVADRLSHLAVAELHAGNWDVAERLAESSCAAVEPIDVRGPLAMVFEKRSLVDAYRGRTDRARATLVPLVERFAAAGQRWWEALALSTLAVVEFADGDDAEVDATLSRMHEAAGTVGVVDVLFDRSEPMHVESLLALGDVDRARVVLERLERRHATLPRPWTALALPRTRALVRAADGDLEGALAILHHDDAAAAARLPFERACTLLVEGRLNRRAKRKRLAAESLREALSAFEGLGAPAWADRARSELERVGLRRRDPTELTPTEQQVAALAARGLTNRQVAEAAFMSPKTVEANLARAYRKLGIRSRAELGALLAAQKRDRPGQT